MSWSSAACTADAVKLAGPLMQVDFQISQSVDNTSKLEGGMSHFFWQVFGARLFQWLVEGFM